MYRVRPAAHRVTGTRNNLTSHDDGSRWPSECRCVGRCACEPAPPAQSASRTGRHGSRQPSAGADRRAALRVSCVAM